MKIPLIAKKSHRYGTRMIQAGDRYDTDGESHARLMVALGNADRAPAAAPAPPPAPEVPKRWTRRPPEQKPAAEGAPGSAPNPEPEKPPVEQGLVSTVRRYARRDLTPSSDE